MILYLTKKTLKDFNLTVEKFDKEKNKITSNFENNILFNMKEYQNKIPHYKWGGKIFYFDRRKCIQLIHFESKLTIVLFDIKVSTIHDLPYYIERYLNEIYSDNKKMLKYIEKYLKENIISYITSIEDRSIITSLNHNQRKYFDNIPFILNFLYDGILHSVNMNKYINSMYYKGKNGEFYKPYDKFIEIMKKRYSKK